MIVCAKFEECAENTVGGEGFLMKAYFSLPQCWQFLAHGCQNRVIDLKFKMGGCNYIALICTQFSDDPISCLDFSFIGGCTLKFAVEKSRGAITLKKLLLFEA